MKKASLIAMFAAFGIAACAGTADNEPATGDVSADMTAAHLYDCGGGGDSNMAGTLARFELAMTPTTASIVDVSKDAAPPGDGRIDPSYHPTAQLVGAIRYRGFDKITETMDEVSQLDLIVPKEFQDNPQQGKVLIREAGPEGGDTQTFFCKTKTKKLAVDVSRKSRFNCNVSLVCTEDNPPGKTCLDSAFVNQTTASAATLRTSYLDHFGVHADPRNVDVGTSTHLSRTTEKFSAEFTGHSIDLKYRAGITYIGKLVLPTGKTADAKCNDLAMLD
jgi:hypothetical protein